MFRSKWHTIKVPTLVYWPSLSLCL